MKLLFYAINGTGLGHLTRLLAIARSCRELLEGLGLEGDIRFLTSSEASEMVWDFPVYKLPSKTVARAVGTHVENFESSSKLLVTNLVGSFSPDILVVDTVPEGSYREVSFLRSLVPRMVYIDRHKDPSVSTTELHQKHIALYDRILVPDRAEAAERYHHPKEVLSRRKFVEPIHIFTPDSALSRAEVREQFGVEIGQRLIYITGGGGSDSREFIKQTVDKLAAEPKNFILIGWGPLHRGSLIFRKNVISLTDARSRELFHGLDAALSAGGYNTYQELLAARVPTVFYAQPKGMDRQDERIALGEKKGWHLCLEQFDSDQATAKIERLLDEDVRGAILDSLEQRPPARGRVFAAVELLLLHTGLSHSPINRHSLIQAVQWKLQWLDSDYSELAVTARRWLKHMCTSEALTEQREQAFLAWMGHQSYEGSGLLHWAAELNALQPRLAIELIRAWCHKNVGDSTAEIRERERVKSTLQVLNEHFDEPESLLDEILSGFKRPYQREALKLLAQQCDQRQEPAHDLLDQLRSEPAPWGQRELRILENDQCTIGR